MRKKTLLTIVSVSMLLLAACGTETANTTDTTAPQATETEKETKTSEEKETTEEETTAEEAKNEKINLEYKDGKLEYLSHEILQDYQGKPLLLVHFNFTNTSDDNKTAQVLFNVNTFQNGIECEFGIMAGENAAYSNLIKEIQPGATLEVAFPFVLQDTSSPADLEVSPLIDFTGNKQKQTINLQ